MGSVRLDQHLQEKMRQAAAAEGTTQSEIHRQALAEYFERKTPQETTSHCDYPFYNDIFGAIEGPHDMAARSGETYREIMDEKYRQNTD